MYAQEKIIRILMHFNALKFKHLIKIHFISNQVFLTSSSPHPHLIRDLWKQSLISILTLKPPSPLKLLKSLLSLQIQDYPHTPPIYPSHC